MIKPLLFSMALICANQAFSQTESQLKQIDSTRKFLATTDFVYPYLDTPPAYAGGTEKWQAYQAGSTVLNDAIKKAKTDKIPAGKYVVVVKFYITADGKVADAKTASKALGFGLDDAALNFVKNSGPWIPANIEGENTKSAVVLPVHFNVIY